MSLAFLNLFLDAESGGGEGLLRVDQKEEMGQGTYLPRLCLNIRFTSQVSSFVPQKILNEKQVRNYVKKQRLRKILPREMVI